MERVLLLSEACGCNVTIRDKAPDKDKAMSCLRSVPAEKLRAQEWITFEFCDFPWTPVVDGEFFTEDPKTSLERGNFKKSEIILGINFDEAMYFIVYGIEDIFPKEDFFSRSEFVTSDAMYDHAAASLLPKKYSKNPAVRKAILFEYRDWQLPGSAYRRQQALDKMLGDYHFACRSLTMLLVMLVMVMERVQCERVRDVVPAARGLRLLLLLPAPGVGADVAGLDGRPPRIRDQFRLRRAPQHPTLQVHQSRAGPQPQVHALLGQLCKIRVSAESSPLFTLAALLSVLGARDRREYA